MFNRLNALLVLALTAGGLFNVAFAAPVPGPASGPQASVRTTTAAKRFENQGWRRDEALYGNQGWRRGEDGVDVRDSDSLQGEVEERSAFGGSD
ncbi:hypothetical protein D9758_011722 [Tetrapyrgos nigripes]|uniref:Uncharacterized protein n=1 Tax=Tetrapyrgos nigripes TaxID=182062 RepID=A0A8H5LMQ9_9AGAR|nr:hypothetical protein D9758_011722 [Tetrapyrgos nigripes]